MFDGGYPPGVTGRMIDEYFDDVDPAEPPRECSNCEYWFNGSCTLAEAEYTAEEIEAMSDEEYTKLVSRDPDDCCEDHKWLED